MNYDLIENVRYGEHERNLVDIAFPENAKGDIDLVLMIHGGGWIGGDKEIYRNEIIEFAQSGVVSASISYRYISDEIHCEDMLDDIDSALKTIKTVAADRGVNIEKVLLTGLSAGGHLSLIYAYSRADSAPVTPAAVVAQSGPADMFSDEAVDAFLYDNEMGSEEFVAGLLSMLCGFKAGVEDRNLQAAIEAHRRVSPVCYVNGNTVPTVICHAENDRIVPFCNAVALEKILSENGVEHELVVYPTSGHCLEKDPECQQKTKELTALYIKKYLKVFGG